MKLFYTFNLFYFYSFCLLNLSDSDLLDSYCKIYDNWITWTLSVWICIHITATAFFFFFLFFFLPIDILIFKDYKWEDTQLFHQKLPVNFYKFFSLRNWKEKDSFLFSFEQLLLLKCIVKNSYQSLKKCKLQNCSNFTAVLIRLHF